MYGYDVKRVGNDVVANYDDVPMKSIKNHTMSRQIDSLQLFEAGYVAELALQDIAR